MSNSMVNENSSAIIVIVVRPSSRSSSPLLSSMTMTFLSAESGFGDADDGTGKLPIEFARFAGRLEIKSNESCSPNRLFLTRFPSTSTRVSYGGVQENRVHSITVNSLEVPNLNFQPVPRTSKLYY